MSVDSLNKKFTLLVPHIEASTFHLNEALDKENRIWSWEGNKRLTYKDLAKKLGWVDCHAQFEFEATQATVERFVLNFNGGFDSDGGYGTFALRVNDNFIGHLPIVDMGGNPTDMGTRAIVHCPLNKGKNIIDLEFLRSTAFYFLLGVSISREQGQVSNLSFGFVSLRKPASCGKISPILVHP